MPENLLQICLTVAFRKKRKYLERKMGEKMLFYFIIFEYLSHLIV